MVAWVPMSPMASLRVARAAARAAGSTTPMTGMGFSAASRSSAVVDTVPQAMTMALRSKVRRKATSCRAYLRMVSLERLP